MAHLFITPHALAACLHKADAPQIIDLCDAEDAAADARRIPGAIPLALADLERSDLAAGSFVCICQKGGKLSQLGAAILRDRGATASALFGGHLAWVADDLPLTSADALAARWVMPTDPDWAELAALWVLRRLIDRRVPVMPVTRDWLDKAAEVWGARVVPSNVGHLTRLANLTFPIPPHLTDGPDRMVAGRLTHVTSPVQALDLVDDWLAGQDTALDVSV
ncbi:hypothetical protein [Jannaschia donghaensis]|uniref:Rhodanese domain-containing protein n=1 Tax=Jannaschia donghaensis TaxID=420998 RepID=A0A0M6YJN3_9RHOB|nr:hypothetical protein [Jannaschia donghaensis]CTQ50160.1 hypothetical protein JDO7802_02178 [Jannaschia donghaensis]